MPTVQNAKKVNAELQRLGFGNLKDPTLPDQFAACVRDHSHFRGILMHIPQGLERAKWYEAMAAKVRFKAKPLADYEIESRTLADQNQLPAYNPETLELREYKPAEFESEEYKQESRKVGASILKSHSEALAETNGFGGQSKLEQLASDAIDRDLREASARYELSLVCRMCTYEQKFRVKNKPAAYKIARRDGWLIEYKSATALCRACKPKAAVQ